MRNGNAPHFIFRSVILPFRKWWRMGMERKTCRKIVCRKCGAEVQRESERQLRKEYPYYCPDCDENMYSFECMEVWGSDDGSKRVGPK